ncbi:exonuclease domain-containing protein [Streptomyces sp. NPDC058595]|uniref:exonuclease domain-containing protein n=1 Tax=Streptomyces sp. NPDC058595 TaxID=3346550 RepID=UPI003659A245
MTTTATIETDDLPVYAAGDAPAHLRTKTGLREDRLKVAEGQRPVAWLRMYRSGHGWGRFPLYDPADSAKMRPLSAKQKRTVQARRTCPECGEVRKYVVHRACAECVERAELARRELYARTCSRCRRVCGAALPDDAYGRTACVPCRIGAAVRRQAERERHAAWQRTCPGHDCSVVTATAEEIEAVRAADVRGWAPRSCPPCAERRTLELAEQRERRVRLEREHREAEQRAAEELRAWAAAALAAADVVVLDVQTTGTHPTARIVEIAVYSSRRELLFHTLVDPGEPIPAGASEIHGITDADVVGKPAFSDALVELTEVLHGKRCLIYNKSFDVSRLQHELTLHYLGLDERAGVPGAPDGAVPQPQAEASAVAGRRAAAWLGQVRFEDVMIPYSEWVGEWNEYHGQVRWQPLNGGHRAAADCRAVLDVLGAMSKGDEDDGAHTVA